MDDRQLEARVEEIVARHAAVGLALAIVRDGRSPFFYCHGYADIASRTPVTPDTAFRIGSITKTFTAIAVMQLVERGLVDLDSPAGDYLRAYRLIPAGTGPPPTVRHLLTHTAGLPEMLYPLRALRPVLGETVRPGYSVPSLARFYHGRLRLVTEPGTTFIYSNHGFATLGQIVEDVTGETLHSYVHRHVFTPLGLEETRIVPAGLPAANRATGYALRSTGPRPIADRELITVGAGAVDSTARDLSRYLTALLGGGANEHGAVLKPDTLSTMYAPQYQPDPRVPGIGLAFLRHDLGGRLTVGHDGLMPGFNAEMAVAPDDGVGVVALTTGARNAKMWLGAEVADLLRYLLGQPAQPVRAGIAQHPEIWPQLHGWYALRGSPRDIQKWFVAGVAVSGRKGRLTLRLVTPIPALSREIALHSDDPSDPYVLRADLTAFGMGTSRVVFSCTSGDPAAAVHLEAVPLSFDRRGASHDPRRWAAGVLAATSVAAAAATIRRLSRPRARA